MYSLIKLISRNTLLGFLFYLLMLVGVGLLAKNTFSTQQSTAVAQIKQHFIEQLAQQNINDVVKFVKNSQPFATFIVENLDGDSIYHFSQSHKELLPFITPDEQVITFPKQNIKISVKLNFNKQIQLLINVLVIALVFTLLFAIITAYLSYIRYKKFFSNIGQHIKQQIHEFNETGEIKSAPSDTFELAELKQGLNEIKEVFSKYQLTAEELEQKAYIDPLTKLANRGKFVQYFSEQVGEKGPVNFGVLMITRCSELQTINKIRGYSEGDNYICKVSELIQSDLPTYKGAELFRLTSSDFAIVLPNVSLKEGENFASSLTSRFNAYQQSSDLDSIAYTGMVYFDSHSQLGELLALADTAISVAQTRQLNSWFVQKDSEILNSTTTSYSNQNWRQEIEQVLENKKIKLLTQPIQPNNRTSKVYHEVLTRFLNANDDMLPTASFVAMAEKLDKITDIDRLIVDSVINHIKEKNLTEHQYGINISARSLYDSHFIIWLERRLLRDSNIAPRLVFEITEFGIQQNIQSSQRFVDMIHRAGARITVERFGVGLTSFKFFRDLKPDFIKMDSTYTRDIDEDKNNQYFLRLMVDLAHRIGINVIAESVETMEEKHTLEKLFIDGCQGYYIAKPSPM